MKDFKVRYLATYNGPSYGSWGLPEFMDAYKSIEAAQDAFKARQKGMEEYTYTFTRNSEDMWVYDGSNWSSFPATTTYDSMELYPIIGDGMFKSLQADDSPALRITAGPRGGAVVERY